MPSAEIRFTVEGLPSDQAAASETLEIIARVLRPRFESVALDNERAVFAIRLDPARSDFRELRGFIAELGRRLGYKLIANLMSP
jgi:hypothetical protein